MDWKRALDRVHALAHVEALDVAAFADALARELPADHDARDAMLRDAVATAEALAVRAMKVRLEHALAGDGSLPAPTRNVFATTIARYAGDRSLLAQRVRASVSRSPDPDRIVALVDDAAQATLAQRAALLSSILALARDTAAAGIADADRSARDRNRSDDERRRWSALRRDLEAVAADPVHVLAAPLAQRLAALPAQLDEPDPAREPTLAELIELD